MGKLVHKRDFHLTLMFCDALIDGIVLSVMLIGSVSESEITNLARFKSPLHFCENMTLLDSFQKNFAPKKIYVWH